MSSLCRVGAKGEKKNSKEYMVQVEIKDKTHVLMSNCSSDPSALGDWYHEKVLKEEIGKKGLKKKGNTVVSITPYARKFGGFTKEDPGVTKICAVVFQIGLESFILHLLSNGGNPNPYPQFLIEILQNASLKHVFLVNSHTDEFLSVLSQLEVKVKTDLFWKIHEKSSLEMVQIARATAHNLEEEIDAKSGHWTAQDLPQDYVKFLALISWCTTLSLDA